MNTRIANLREASLKAVPRISDERARLITEFYKHPETAGLPVPVQRGKALLYLMQNKAVHIGENELIVGERGPAPKAVPTYPEVCVHSLRDLEILLTCPVLLSQNKQALIFSNLHCFFRTLTALIV